jgi:hypothetical protein
VPTTIDVEAEGLCVAVPDQGACRAAFWHLGRGLGAAYQWIQIGLVLVSVAIFILTDRPVISAVLWTTAAVVAVLLVLEILVRAGNPTAREASA